MWGVAQLPISYSGQGFSPIGEKGRFVLPPDFRKAVKESGEGERVLCLAKHDRWRCLVGFGLSRLVTLEDQLDREERNALDRGADFDRDMRSAQLYGFARVPFDDSGRFVMPDRFFKLGNVETALFFQGGGSFFTLWNPDELARMGAGWEDAQEACAEFAAQAAKGARK
jgi:MraZ protein